MARDEDLDDAPHDEELEEEGESEESDDESPDDDFELESDEALIEDGDFDEERDEDEVAVVRTPAKRRTTLRHVPMIEGVPKSKLEKPDFAREVWRRLDEKYHDDKAVRYAISGAFEVHQAIEHSKFGIGFVTEVLGPNKVEVIFQDSIRKLVQKR